MAQLVEHLTLDFSSGCDTAVCEFEPHIRLCIDSADYDSLSLPPSLPFPCSGSHSLSRNKLINLKKKKKENNSKEALHVLSAKPDVGLELRKCEIMT